MKSSKRFFALTAIIIVTSTLHANTEPTKEAQVTRTFDLVEAVPQLSLIQKGKILGESVGAGALALFSGAMAYGLLKGKPYEAPATTVFKYPFGSFFVYVALKLAQHAVQPLKVF